MNARIAQYQRSKLVKQTTWRDQINNRINPDANLKMQCKP